MMRQYKDPKALVTRLAGIHAERREMQKLTDALQAEERELLAQALTLLPSVGLSNVDLSVGKLRIGTQPIATIQDWPVLYESVYKSAQNARTSDERDRFLSVIHKRVSATALEKLSFEKIFLDGVLLEHKKVALFTAAREKKS